MRGLVQNMPMENCFLYLPNYCFMLSECSLECVWWWWFNFGEMVLCIKFRWWPVASEFNVWSFGRFKVYEFLLLHKPKVLWTCDTAMDQNLKPWMVSDDGDSITGRWCSVSDLVRFPNSQGSITGGGLMYQTQPFSVSRRWPVGSPGVTILPRST